VRSDERMRAAWAVDSLNFDRSTPAGHADEAEDPALACRERPILRCSGVGGRSIPTGRRR
jgi:hypothetical protein